MRCLFENGWVGEAAQLRCRVHRQLTKHVVSNSPCKIHERRSGTPHESGRRNITLQLAAGHDLDKGHHGVPSDDGAVEPVTSIRDGGESMLGEWITLDVRRREGGIREEMAGRAQQIVTVMSLARSRRRTRVIHDTCVLWWPQHFSRP